MKSKLARINRKGRGDRIKTILKLVVKISGVKMQARLCILLLSFLCGGALQHVALGQTAPAPHRYRVYHGRSTEHLRFGFIDQQGKPICPTSYAMAQHFTEGLAAVREHLKWGFIDSAGQCVIPMQYDWVLPFEDGIAEVGVGSERRWIDHRGEVAFPSPFCNVNPFHSGDHNVGTTPDHKAAAINRSQRKVILDSNYAHIRSFSDGVAVVSGRLLPAAAAPRGMRETRELAVIDDVGNVLIPFGRFSNLSDFMGGYAITYVDAPDHAGLLAVQVIDHHGVVQSVFASDRWAYRSHDLEFSEGLAKASYYVIDTILNDGGNMERRARHCSALVKPSGEIVHWGRDWVEITAFHAHRAFARLRDGQWILIDTLGNRVGNASWLGAGLMGNWDAAPGDFENGFSFARSGNSSGWIDVHGNFVTAPQPLGKDERFEIVRGDFVIVKQSTPGKYGMQYKFGYWHRPTNVYVAPRFASLEIGDQKGALMAASTDRFSGYIDLQGDFVWKARRLREDRKADQDARQAMRSLKKRRRAVTVEPF